MTLLLQEIKDLHKECKATKKRLQEELNDLYLDEDVETVDLTDKEQEIAIEQAKIELLEGILTKFDK